MLAVDIHPYTTQAIEAQIPMQSALALRDVRKYFVRRDGTQVPAVDGIDLEVKQGEFVVLLGPSGCGKTTLLRCIAGLESPNSGSISIQGSSHFSSQENLDTSPDKRNLGMVFQSYALWPHMKVFSNVAYPLKMKGVSKERIKTQVGDVLQAVGIPELGEQYPGQLSGGQQQRVALARALVSSGGLLLFDEPLSNVDAKVREQLRYEIRRMQVQSGFAAIYVTHDQEEAMELADRIAVLNKGAITQLDTAQAIYDTPASRYVAKFIGATNEIFGEVVEAGSDGHGVVDSPAGKIRGIFGERGLAVGDRVSVIIRPEKCQILPGSPSGWNEWSIAEATTLFMGAINKINVHIEGWDLVQIHQASTTERQAGDAKVYMPEHFARIYRR